MNGNKDEDMGGLHIDGNPGSHIRRACTLAGHNSPYSSCQNFSSGRNEGCTGERMVGKSRKNASSEERGRRVGNTVLRSANVASGRGSSFPEETSSTMVEQGQPSKPSKHRNPFFQSKCLVRFKVLRWQI